MNIEAALKNLDNPIETFEQDLLQRVGFAENFCQILAAASPNESNVFALNGEWGSGKTSVKNLIKNELSRSGEKAPFVIEFNPWAFSGQDQVLEAFFSEIAKIIGRGSDGKAVAEGFRKLGAYLSFGAKTVKTLHIGMDLFGIPGSKIIGLVGEQMESGTQDTKDYGGQIESIGKVSLEEVQKELKEGLIKFNRSLLIILDDLDRLTPEQLLLVFQIVKQNANLPRVNFLLLMDPKTIGVRLEKMNLGAEFIEKIVQYELTLPHIPDEELKLILKEGFKFVMGKYAEQIDWNRWEEAWTNGCQNLFTNLRRIKRFLHTLKFHVIVFSNDDVLEVDPVDIFLI
jgi:predicted KAP-like P-loop ATPase